MHMNVRSKMRVEIVKISIKIVILDRSESYSSILKHILGIFLELAEILYSRSLNLLPCFDITRFGRMVTYCVSCYTIILM